MVLLRSQKGSALSHAEMDGNWSELDTAIREASSRVDVNLRTATYTLALSDAGKVIEMNVGAANLCVIPPNSAAAFPVGTVIEVCQVGTGRTTIVAGAGVTLRGPEAALRTQWSMASIRKRSTDEWVASGDFA